MALLWPFPPDKLKVELAWLTSVLSTYETEQRAKLRVTYPRATFKHTALLTEDQTFRARRIAENALNEFLIPDWRYAVKVAGPYDASNLTIPVDDAFFYPEATERIVAWKSPTEHHSSTIATRGVDTLDAADGPASPLTDFWLLPLHPAVSRGGLRVRNLPNSVTLASLQLETRTYKNLSSFAPSYPIYQTYGVMTDRDVFKGSHTAEVVKFVNYVDSLTGKVETESLFDHIDQRMTFSADDTGSAELIKREGWLHERAGKLVPFWKPSWGRDVRLKSGASAGATSLSAYPNAPAADYEGRHFCIDQNGSKQFFQVASASESGDTLTLTLSAGLSSEVVLENVTTVSEMNLVRLDSDSIEIAYSSGIRGAFNVTLAGLDNDL